MGFCNLGVESNGIFVLTMVGTKGHQYLTDEAISELAETLRSLKSNPELKGLVTTSGSGSFCDGIDYDNKNNTVVEAARLAKSTAEVIKLLLEMPAPTVAAIGGNATSLGLALALAHDHCVLRDGAVLGLPEAKRGRPLPRYVTTLLHKEVAYARLRKLMVLRSHECTGSEFAGSPWYSAHKAVDNRDMVLEGALELLEGLNVGEETDYAMARQMLNPESCAAVGLEAPTQQRRPSPDELERDGNEVENVHSSGRIHIGREDDSEDNYDSSDSENGSGANYRIGT